MLGSGQAAGMALGASMHSGMSSGLNASSGPLAVGAARYLAGLGMGPVVSIAASSYPPHHTMFYAITSNPK